MGIAAALWEDLKNKEQDHPTQAIFDIALIPASVEPPSEEDQPSEVVVISIWTPEKTIRVYVDLDLWLTLYAKKYYQALEQKPPEQPKGT